VSVCVCVCERERERKRESLCVENLVGIVEVEGAGERSVLWLQPDPQQSLPWCRAFRFKESCRCI